MEGEDEFMDVANRIEKIDGVTAIYPELQGVGLAAGNEGRTGATIRAVEEDIFEANVYVFTPTGKVIELAQGSTPVDFAYRIHSKVGDTMVLTVKRNGSEKTIEITLAEQP